MKLSICIVLLNEDLDALKYARILPGIQRLLLLYLPLGIYIRLYFLCAIGFLGKGCILSLFWVEFRVWGEGVCSSKTEGKKLHTYCLNRIMTEQSRGSV